MQKIRKYDVWKYENFCHGMADWQTDAVGFIATVGGYNKATNEDHFSKLRKSMRENNILEYVFLWKGS